MAADVRTFLRDAGWADAAREDLPGDASTRRYARLARDDGAGDGETALLMMAPPTADGDTRSDYAVAANLAGDDPLAFCALTRQLTQRGFSAPAILHADIGQGLVLLEDLGDRLLARVLEAEPAREAELYGRAVDTLGSIYRSTFPDAMGFSGRDWRVEDYSAEVLLTETHLYLDWYARDRGVKADAAARTQWDRAWRDAFPALDAHAPGLTLRDYHAENLFVLDDRDFEAATGLIDYQDALFGHPAYDLVSLLEDARRDVSPDIVDQAIERFCHRARITSGPEFRAAYAVLGAQRAAKVLGIFVRLAERDGKPRYRAMIPRVEAHFARALAHPALEGVRDWVEAHGLGEAA